MKLNDSSGPIGAGALNLGTVVVTDREAVSYWQPLPSCGYVTVAITPDEAPFDAFSCGTQLLPPGRYVREHGHTRNHELIHVCTGSGTLTVDGSVRPIGAGDTILFGRNSAHRIDNAGPLEMKLFWVFFPPGLEDWFQAIGRPRSAGESAPAPFERPQNVADIMARMRFMTPRAAVDPGAG
jgi:quercetin dioxygenase-like cupin family protein